MERGKKRIEAAFGAVVCATRHERGLSQEELADAAALHRTYVSQIERGIKSPSLETMRRLSVALGIPLHELVRDACRRVDSPTPERR